MMIRNMYSPEPPSSLGVYDITDDVVLVLGGLRGANGLAFDEARRRGVWRGGGDKEARESREDGGRDCPSRPMVRLSPLERL